MNVLVACESSGTVRNAFRAKGHCAWSCDLLPADDGSPFHYQADAIDLILHGGWELVIAHPPCTHLCSSGARWWPEKRLDGRQQEGMLFFMGVMAACDLIGARWAVENPIGIMSKEFRKPDQIVQPWQFGHPETKATCLWLHRLPPLNPTNIVPGREARCHRLSPSPDRWKLRSKTYQGLADAMADQWGDVPRYIWDRMI
jgi:hypothetical protein